MARLTREHANLRAAVEYCLAEPGRADAVLHVAVTLPGLYWWTGGLVGESRRWLDLALAQVTAPTTVRARALLFDSHIAIAQDQADVGLRLLDEGATLARQLGATAELALAAHVRGMALLYRGELPAAIEAFESTQDILATVPESESGFDLELRLALLIVLGMAAGLAGDQQRADACLVEVLSITESRGEHRYRSYALWARALSAWRQGNFDETLTSLAAGLRLNQVLRSPDRYGTARCLEAAAWVAAAQRQYPRAATLLGAADTLWTQVATPITAYGHLIDHHNDCERQTHAGLSDAAFTDAFTQGQNLSHDDAIAYALNQ